MVVGADLRPKFFALVTVAQPVVGWWAYQEAVQIDAPERLRWIWV